MRPLDPRLLRYARATRSFLVVSVVLGVATAAAVIAQALLLGEAISAAFQQHATLHDQRAVLVALALVVVLRAALAWGGEVSAHRASAAAKSQLRSALLAHALRLGPVWLTGARTGELTTLATRGVNALDSYFSRYLPQLVLACIVPPAVVVTVFVLDPLSALIIALTVPLIPLFLALIGTYTKGRVDRQYRTLAVLSGHFLDLTAGLPTLKVFGRAKAQERSIESVGEQYRTTTMGVLRVSFLSSFALELVATLSVALVAVSIGLRLVNGSLGLRAGLTVLLLAPEAYLPIRLVGQHFHAAAEGLGAAERVFEVLETPTPTSGACTDVPDLARCAVVVDRLEVTYAGRTEPALAATSLVLEPGTVTAVVGPSGAGKSTLLAALLGFVAPSRGRVVVRPAPAPGHAAAAEVDVADLDPDAWRAQVAYVAQEPYLPGARLADVVRLGRPDADDDAVRTALASAGLDLADPDVTATLPEGLATVVGEGGVGLSAGQARRVALARAFCRDAPLVVLDEPTAALDGATEDVVVEAVRALRAAGRTVVVVAHRPALLLVADRVVTVAPAAAALEAPA